VTIALEMSFRLMNNNSTERKNHKSGTVGTYLHIGQ